MSSQRLGVRAIRGSVVSLGASFVTLALGLVRSVLLARWLAPEQFGVVALAMFFIGLVAQIRGIGLDQALLHRQNVDDDFLGSYFSARLSLDVIAYGLFLLCIPLLRLLYPHSPDLARVLYVLIPAVLLANLSQVQETFLRKHLAYRSLALTDVFSATVMTIVAPYLAWHGWGVWALVAEYASGVTTRMLLTWLPFRQWRPVLRWRRREFRWLWEFGRPTWWATTLNYLLERFGDWWLGTFLGSAPLGFYAKAIEWGHYPRRIFANPLVTVFSPIFALSQTQPLRRSQAFFRSAHLLIRLSFLGAGLLALAMPEFIHYIIGDKWQPMLLTFRLMLVFVLLDSWLLLMQELLVVTGQPQAVKRVRAIQLAFFVPAVIVGGAVWGVNGVAVAASGMAIVGALGFLGPLRQSVNFSARRLLLWPSLAFVVGASAGLGWELTHPGPLWISLGVKLLTFSLLFCGILFLSEREDYTKGMRQLISIFKGDESDG